MFAFFTPVWQSNKKVFLACPFSMCYNITGRQCNNYPCWRQHKTSSRAPLAQHPAPPPRYGENKKMPKRVRGKQSKQHNIVRRQEKPCAALIVSRAVSAPIAHRKVRFLSFSFLCSVMSWIPHPLFTLPVFLGGKYLQFHQALMWGGGGRKEGGEYQWRSGKGRYQGRIVEFGAGGIFVHPLAR